MASILAMYASSLQPHRQAVHSWPRLGAVGKEAGAVGEGGWLGAEQTDDISIYANRKVIEYDHVEPNAAHTWLGKRRSGSAHCPPGPAYPCTPYPAGVFLCLCSALIG